MTRKRILFVDDEPNVLEGLQNILRKHRRDWEMVFAPGGEAALAEMAKGHPFDVVVSDMRMPGMDGGTLLRHVQSDYPKAARIVLSGHADRESVVRALPVAHQYLSKPCDADVLRQVIDQTCRLQGLLHDDALRVLVGRLDKLPSVPRSYLELTEAVARPSGGLTEVARVVERDPAMSAKVLQLVNSAYFGSSQRIFSVQRAVIYLGIELIQGLALTAQVFDTLKDTPVSAALSLDDLQEHSLLTARLARRFVTDPHRSDEAFSAAIVHDIGRIVLALAFADKYAEAAQVSRVERRPLDQVEKEAFGVTHAEAGAYLLGVWGLPATIVETVAYHHTPRVAQGAAREIVAAVHVADALAQLSSEDCAQAENNAGLDMEFIRECGLETMLPRWKDAARSQLSALEGAA